MDYLRKIKALAMARSTVQFTYYESHAYDPSKKENRTGFIESMLWCLDNGKALSQKQIEVIDKMYDKYIAQGEEKTTVQTKFEDETKTIEAQGGFIKVNGEAIDPPIDKKDAPIVAKWLFEAWNILGEIFRSLNDSATDFPTSEDNKTTAEQTKDDGSEPDPF